MIYYPSLPLHQYNSIRPVPYRIIRISCNTYHFSIISPRNYTSCMNTYGTALKILWAALRGKFHCVHCDHMSVGCIRRPCSRENRWTVINPTCQNIGRLTQGESPRPFGVMDARQLKGRTSYMRGSQCRRKGTRSISRPSSRPSSLTEAFKSHRSDCLSFIDAWKNEKARQEYEARYRHKTYKSESAQGNAVQSPDVVPPRRLDRGCPEEKTSTAGCESRSESRTSDLLQGASLHC